MGLGLSESIGSRRFGRAWSDVPDAGGPRRFTNTAVPRFDGTGCWQHLDGAADEASIGNIVDSCRIWERPNSWGVLDGIRMVVS